MRGLKIDSPFSLEELEVLKKYKTPRMIDPEDEDVLNKYSLVGFVRWGYSISKKRKTATLTKVAIPIVEFWDWKFKNSGERAY